MPTSPAIVAERMAEITIADQGSSPTLVVRIADPYAPMPTNAGLAQGDLARLSDEQHESHRHHEAGAHESEDRQVVTVVQVCRDGHREHGEDQEAGVAAHKGHHRIGRRRHCLLTTFAPRSPAGRMKSTSSRMTKAMASL